MENKRFPSKHKSYLTGIGMVLLTFGLAFILAYVFNQTGIPVESTNFITIYGSNKGHSIVGRRLFLSEGNYFTGIRYGRGVKFQAGTFVPLAHKVKSVRWMGECLSNYYKNGSMADCLTLNVYQCTSVKSRFLPVLVYVHEGEPNWDSTANLDANQVINNLACKGMVVVSVHYRQTIFGSLSFTQPSPAVSDVQLALEWVKRTIRHFNGDPSAITLFGSRRGAQIASYLSRMPKTRALFSQAILIGGVADDPALFPGNHQFLYKQIHKIAKHGNCTFGNEDPERMSKEELEEVIQCMKELQKSFFLRSDHKLHMSFNRWPLDTSDLVGQGEAAPINVMLGTCRHPSTQALENINRDNLETTINRSKDFKRTHNSNAFFEHYLDRYLNASIGLSEIRPLIRYDFVEVGPLLLEAHRLAAQANSRVFMFNLETNQTRYDYNPEIRRVPAEKIAPCLEHLLFRNAPAGDLAVQRFMADSVANFVTNGNPNKVNTTDLKWTEFSATKTPNTYNVLNINSEGIEIVENWETNSAKFWLCERDRARNSTASAYCSS